MHRTRLLGSLLAPVLLAGTAAAQQSPKDDALYTLENDVLIRTHDGATLSAKRRSTAPDRAPMHEASDADEVIDWIVHQGWSDGQVSMRGGRPAFSAWAAA